MFTSPSRRLSPRVIPAADLSGRQVYRAAAFGMSTATIGMNHLHTGKFITPSTASKKPSSMATSQTRRRRRHRPRPKSAGIVTSRRRSRSPRLRGRLASPKSCIPIFKPTRPSSSSSSSNAIPSSIGASPITKRPNDSTTSSSAVSTQHHDSTAISNTRSSLQAPIPSPPRRQLATGSTGPAIAQRAALALKGQGYITISAHHHLSEGKILFPHEEPSSSPASTEKRWDGDEMFTKPEFVDFYGGEEEWNDAEPVVAPTSTPAPSKSRSSLSKCRSSFSVETWIYISRTEALYSESSTRVRKHNGIECDSEGHFLSWKCCGRDDPDPLSWCPVWEGDTRNILPQIVASAASQTKVTLERECQTHQNTHSAPTLPEAIYATHRTRPCVVAAQECSIPLEGAGDNGCDGTAAYAFFLHDAGAVASDGTEYGFGLRWADNTTTVVTDYHVPVDRWVYFAATYDGCYMSVYIDGELVASKCRDTPTVDNQQDDIPECMISANHPVTVGGTARGGNNFVGCMGYFRFWDHARDHAAILSNTHDWFKYQHASKLNNTVSNASSANKSSSSSHFAHYSSLASKFRNRSAADDVMMPVVNLSGCNTQHQNNPKGLIVDLAICELHTLNGRHIANSCPGRAVLCGTYGWRIHPPLYFGIDRVYLPTRYHPEDRLHRQSGKHKEVCLSSSTQLTTAAPANVAGLWGWMSLCTLAEQVRSHGKTVVTIAWRCQTSAQGRLRKIANGLVWTLSKQLFCQDWAVELQEEEVDAKQGTVNDSPASLLPQMTVSFRYFDADGAEQNWIVWDSAVDDVDVGDTGTCISGTAFLENPSVAAPDNNAADTIRVWTLPSLSASQLAPRVLQVIEACIRGATTRSHRLLHAHLRNTFRSRLWSEEFGSSFEEMGFSHIFAALDDVSGGNSVEELMVQQHAKLPSRRAKLHTRIIQREFVEGLWVAGMLSKMPRLCSYAVRMATRAASSRIDADREAMKNEVDHFRSVLSSSVSSEETGVDASPSASSTVPPMINGGLSPLARLRAKAKLAGSLKAKFEGYADKIGTTAEMHEDALIWVDGLQATIANAPRLQFGHKVKLSVNSPQERLVSYSVVVIWETQMRGHTLSSLEATCGLDAFCLSLDDQYVPIETLSRRTPTTLDTSGRCRGQDRTFLELFREYEKSTSGWVRRAQRFDFDLNMSDQQVQSLALILGPNASREPAAFQPCGNVTLRLERVYHDVKSFKRLAFERRRKTGGTNVAMNQTTNLNAKVARREVIGENVMPCAGQHSAMLLGTFQRIKSDEWGFRLELEKIHGAPTEFEQIHHTARLQRLTIRNRRPCVDITHCCNCETHRRTSWHVPGQFEGLFRACQRAITSEFPRVLVRGHPSPERVGAFEVIFKSHESAEGQLLYSALRRQGWLPAPELVVQLVRQVSLEVGGGHLGATLKPTSRSPAKRQAGRGHDEPGASLSSSFSYPPKTSLSRKKIRKKNLRFSVRDAISKLSVRHATVHVFSIFDATDMRNAANWFGSQKQFANSHDESTSAASVAQASDADIPKHQETGNNESDRTDSSLQLSNTIVPHGKHFILRTNARGRCEVEVDAGHTYFVHITTPGYYPVQISAVYVPPESDGGTSPAFSSSSKVSSASTHAISLLPLIERVSISIGDLETGQKIRAKGIEVTLVNRRTATRHTATTDVEGITNLNVPRGTYRIQVGAPLFDEIPYAMTNDKAAMSFIETATAFDKARRDGFKKKEIRISVHHHVQQFVGIPSLRWPWHFKVMDNFGKPLRGVKFEVKDRSGKNVFVSKSSRRGTASGMIELGMWATLHVSKPVGGGDGTKSKSRLKGKLSQVKTAAKAAAIHGRSTTTTSSCGSSAVVRQYLPFEESLLEFERKRSPLMVKIMLCPQPPPQCARAILSWSHRCWIDLHVNVKSLATTGGKQEIHVWRKCTAGAGVILEFAPNNGHGPMSCIIKLLPLAEYRFSAIQHGSFRANKQSMITLAHAQPEILLCDRDRTVVHAKHKDASVAGAPERWTDAIVIRTDEAGRLIA